MFSICKISDKKHKSMKNQKNYQTCKEYVKVILKPTSFLQAKFEPKPILDQTLEVKDEAWPRTRSKV